MKTSLLDVTITRRDLIVEISSTEVENMLEQVTSRYRRTARIPGFRPGKAPTQIIRQRFRDHILHDAADELVPRAVNEALQEQNLKPVDKPAISDLKIEDGQPLKFTASFEVIPPIEAGEYKTISLRRPTVTVEPSAVDEAIERLRHQLARIEAVENRGVNDGDIVGVDIERTMMSVLPEDLSGASQLVEEPPSSDTSTPKMETQQDVSIEIGNTANPPGFDKHLINLLPEAKTHFVIQYPEDHGITELAGTSVDYTVKVKNIKRRVLPDLDDEFAKDAGDFDSIEALRERVLSDLQTQAKHEADRSVRSDLLQHLAKQVTFELPSVLVERELDSRLEEFVRHLVHQKVDPAKANIDWKGLREEQRPAATEAVRGVLALDEIARLENMAPTNEEVDQELERQAAKIGRTLSAVKAQLEKEHALERVYTGLQREKTIDFVLSHATILAE